MAGNQNNADKMHKRMPAFYKTKTNPNWKAVIDAIGESDDSLAELLQEVRKQFFIATSSRPYIDRLGANNLVSRPRFVGMSDEDFRKFIPIVAYQPKQVKLVFDQLLDIFFFKDATTSFTQSTIAEPFTFKDGWGLEYNVDNVHSENIKFSVDDFNDINNISADEIVAAINRQALYSFAIVYDDRIKKKKFIRIFTSTVGAKGSISMVGGLANLDLKFNGFIDGSGSGSDTVWNITKVGDTMTFEYVSGTNPQLQNVAEGDYVLVDIPNNEGVFKIETINLSEGKFTFTNLFGTAMVFSHASLLNTQVKFMKDETVVIFEQDTRAVVWEVSPGEIIVEMPASPPVVKRSLAGSAHINGLISNVTEIVDQNTLELEEFEDFPTAGGKFVLKELKSILTHIETEEEDLVTDKQYQTRFDKNNIFTYTSRVGNQLQGIVPDLPVISQLFEFDIDTVERSSNSILTITTVAANSIKEGDSITIIDSTGPVPTQGIRIPILSTDNDTTIANKTASILDTYSFFSASNLLGVVTITDATNNNTQDAVDVDSGAVVTTIQQGQDGIQPEITQVDLSGITAANFDVSGNGLRWEISTNKNQSRYHIWYDVTDGANTQNDVGVTPGVNNSYVVQEVVDNTTFKCFGAGTDGISTGGRAKVERYGNASSGSQVYLTSAQVDTGVIGPYIWDQNANFVISSLTANIAQDIKAGTSVKTLAIDTPNNIPDQEGFLIFGFGTSSQEGPVRCLFKPSDSSLQLDPAYVFENNHEIGDGVTMIRRKGAHVMSGLGTEYAPYVTDPSIARDVLQNLILEVKSVGIFVDFLVRFPEQFYSSFDVYGVGDPNDDLYPIKDTDT